MVFLNNRNKKAAACFIGLALVISGFALFQTGTNNFHEVIPAELYRSGQFGKGDIQAYVKNYGIRSVINLRGANAGADWYDNEVRDTEQAHVQHYDFRMSSKRMLNNKELLQLISMMREAPKPVLIHCNGGANRTGFAVATYLAAIARKDEHTAEAQLSIRYGNFPEWLGSQSKMTHNFELIENTLGYKGS